MLTFVVCLRSGGDFIVDDAVILSRQVQRHLRIPHRFVCLSDLPFTDPYIDVIPLEKNYPGWWSVTETFRMTGPTIVTGLDVILVDNIDRLGELALTCPSDVFYMTRPQAPGLRKGTKMVSGIMMWNGDWSWIYNQFKREYMKRFKGEEKYTTWQLLRNKINVRLMQDYFQGFYSYKLGIRGKRMPEDVRFIAFHGKPRPRQCKEPWAEEILNDYSVPHHHLADDVAA